jgi:hypothetical protein
MSSEKLKTLRLMFKLQSRNFKGFGFNFAPSELRH